jgi:large subunit ribosomal protein L2
MPIVRRKPRSASLRFQTFLDTSDLTKKSPEKSLTVGLRKRGGRGAYGRITTRHRGGGAARKYRIIDFKRLDRDIPGKIVAVEYDPNRNVRLGLVVFQSGAKRYMLLPEGLGIGSSVMASEQAELQPGHSMPLRQIPIGFMVHNVEMYPGSGGKLARGAGTSMQLMAKEGDYATFKMPSDEIRMIHLDCWATIGMLGNAEYKNIVWGKAGRTRNRGFRSSVRGMAMNPVDHPHGGGEGRSKSGEHPRSPWGKGSKGTRTRRRESRFILKRRRQ